MATRKKTARKMTAKKPKPAAATLPMPSALRAFVVEVGKYAHQDNARGHELAQAAEQLLLEDLAAQDRS